MASCHGWLPSYLVYTTRTSRPATRGHSTPGSRHGSGAAGRDHVFQPGDVPVALEVALRGEDRELPVAHHVPHHMVELVLLEEAGALERGRPHVRGRRRAAQPDRHQIVDVVLGLDDGVLDPVCGEHLLLHRW